MGDTGQSGERALRLVAACCRWPGGAERDAAVRLAAEGFADWPRFLAMVERHRVAGLVHAALPASGVAMPADAEHSLARLSADTRLHSLACAAETVRLQKLFDREGVGAVFFKGATAAQRIYGSPAIKHSKDVDFLVPAAQAQACVALLGGHGYTTWTPRRSLTAGQWRSLLRFGKEMSMVNPLVRVQIEPHWRLTGNPRFLAAPATATVPIGGRPIRTLEADDEFVYLCVHGAESGWCRLKWLADVNGWIAGASEAEVERLYRHAATHGVAASMAVALSLCADWFGREIPPRIAARVARSRALRAMRAIANANLRAATTALSWRVDTAMNLLLAATHGYLPHQLWQAMIALDDTLRFPLPRPLHGLYPVLRVPMALWRRVRRVRSSRAAPRTAEAQTA